MIRNPFNETMKVQMFVGRTTFQMENELRKLRLIAMAEGHDMNESLEQEKPRDRFADKLMQ